MIDKDGDAKVMDFGIARSLAGGGTTVEGAIIGTPEYMSPEQVDGKPADGRADIYALGVILFEMVTGRPLFEGETPLAVTHKHKYEPAPDPMTLNPQIPSDLGRLILRCLEKEREKRYQTTGELTADLKAVDALLPTTEPASAGRSATKHKSGTSKTITVKTTPKKLIIPAAVLIVIAAVVFIWMKFGSGNRQPSPDSIAVLPFQYRGEDKENEYRADAMTDALTGKLVQFSGLQKVIARQSAMQYKNSIKKASEIARELGVKYLVEGSFLQTIYQVQITVLLIDARTDRNLWSYEFSGDAEDIVELHNEIARAIVSKIKVKLTPQEETRLAKAKPVDPITYDSFIKALFNPTSQLSLEDTIRSAEENLKDIIRQDPGFVPPYMTLASVYWDSSGMNIVHPYVGFIKAREMAIKALELDETLGGAHAILGSLKGILDYDYVGAQEEFNRALVLSPNDASLFTMYCIFLNYEGRFEEALAAGRRSIELDPIAPIRRANLAWTYYRSGRQDDAL
ncbi:MAG: protein kinase, partial [Methanosarcinaceae archaeon]|nr:protein kinase [Methanosarcinaceae archaeon]